jgi:toxin ParE1/3/4
VRRDDLLPGSRTIGFERRITIAFVVTADTVLIEDIFYGAQDFEGLFHDEVKRTARFCGSATPAPP